MKLYRLFPVTTAVAAMVDLSILASDFAPPPGATTLTRRELHKNILNNFPSESVMNTTIFEEYLMANPGE